MEQEDSELHAAAWKITSLKKSVDGFGQGEEVRVIDTSKQCGPNDACGLPEKFVLHGVDYIADTLIRALLHGQFGSGSAASFLSVSSSLFFILPVELDSCLEE